ncbi:MAG: tRNA dihydrouridine(20/20a) synthase DusA [Acidobacteria bacterium]|nr:tRNA dihydrouridine(20/20a) synthase DusA [Acidobacteriota bacterium]MCB9397309.1 tRNA dihydrouridine(20/20a) synthase DusA [Acidobacteriota bacterium]
MQPVPAHRLSIAPMMAYTDRHFRWLMRLFTQKSLLYTEMVVANTLHYRPEPDHHELLLGFDPIEHPLAVQLGGDAPESLVPAAIQCQQRGYDEINLNVGCPSDRVQKGRFGACLMLEPEHVGDLLAQMRGAVDIPVTVKHRLGVDEQDDLDFLMRFVEVVARKGTQVFIVHARKAWLSGLSPAQNRSIPPLLYERVYELKRHFPELTIVINGGITTLQEVKQHLQHVDGVMIGRAAYQNPELFWQADHVVYGAPLKPQLDWLPILASAQTYFREQVAQGTKASHFLKHLLGFFKGRPGSRHWRHALTIAIQQGQQDVNLAELFGSTIGQAENLAITG